MVEQTISKQVNELLNNLKEHVKIPVGISNKHIHLTEADFNYLFPNETIKVKKMLNQPGEFAAEQVVTVKGLKGELSNVRILGPFRSQSQVELALTDARKIGVNAPIRLSGDIQETPGVVLKSPNAELTLTQGVIVAKRHIHISTADAKLLKLEPGASVSVKLQSPNRSLIFSDCIIRVGDNFNMEMHIDTDEANAAGATAETIGKIISH